MSNILKVAIIVFLPISLLLTTVERVTFDINYFDKKYSEYDIATEIGIKKDDLTEVTEELLRYLKGKRNDILIVKKISGKEKQVFGKRERLHMIDVKNLFISGFKVRNLTLVVSIISLIIISIKYKKELGKTLILSSILYLSLIILLMLLIYIDFNKCFTYFHKIFFRNDLWLLDFKTDILIQMLPLEFFQSITYKITKLFIAELTLMMILGLYLNKGYKKNKNVNN